MPVCYTGQHAACASLKQQTTKSTLFFVMCATCRKLPEQQYSLCNVCAFWQEVGSTANKVTSNSNTPKLIHGTCSPRIDGVLMQEALQAALSRSMAQACHQERSLRKHNLCAERPITGNCFLTSVDVLVQEAHQAADLKTDDADLPEGGPAGE